MNLAIILAAIALVLGGVAVVRSKGEDLAGWGVAVLAALLLFL